MDTGILGFFVLLFALAAGLVWVFRFYRRAETVLTEAGFVKAVDVPIGIATALEATFGSDASLLGQWHRSDGSWVVDVLLETGDEGPGSRIAACIPIGDRSDDVVALSYTGAGPSSWLGRVGVRLTEAGSPELARRHRLTDVQNVLTFEHGGFVAWSSQQGDVSALIPPPVAAVLRSTRGIEGLTAAGGTLIVWSAWSVVDALLTAIDPLRAGFGPTPAR